MIAAFFVADGDLLVPQARAVSGWASDTVRGPALCAALARTAEPLCPEGMRPARALFELFRPAPLAPLATRASLVRRGGRLCLVDAFLSHDGVDVARAHVTFVRPSADPEGATWRPVHDLLAPPPGTSGDAEGRLYRGQGAWTARAADVEATEPKSAWQANGPLVADEPPTPFQLAAAASDFTSLVAHWGTHGIEFINADIALAMARPPSGAGVGLRVLDANTADGISSGASVLFDDRGAFGSANLIALANAAHAVRFGTSGAFE